MADSLSTTILGIAAAAGAAFSFLAAPLLSFADPVSVFNSGLGCIVGASIFASGELTGSRVWSWIGRAACLAGFLGWAWTMGVAASTANAARAHCSRIQNDMLAAKPRVPNGPEVFQAMGCHPQ